MIRFLNDDDTSRVKQGQLTSSSCRLWINYELWINYWWYKPMAGIQGRDRGARERRDFQNPPRFHSSTSEKEMISPITNPPCSYFLILFCNQQSLSIINHRPLFVNWWKIWRHRTFLNLEQPPFRAKGAEVLCAWVVVQVVWVGVERVDGAGTEKRSVSISPGGLLVDCARRFQCLLTGFKIQ